MNISAVLLVNSLLLGVGLAMDEDKTEYIAIDPRLKDAGSIITIGFERDTAYLANALEIFLISKIQPVHNVVKVGM